MALVNRFVNKHLKAALMQDTYQVKNQIKAFISEQNYDVYQEKAALEPEFFLEKD